MLLGGLLADTSWRMVYLALAAITLAAVIPLSLLLRRQVPEEPDLPTTTARITPRAISFTPAQLQWLLALAGVGCCVAMSMPQVHIVSFCVDLGYGPAVGAQRCCR